MNEPTFSLHQHMRRFGTRIVHLIEDIGLTIVLIATTVAGGIEVHAMWVQRQVLLTDLLLMFIYIEMVTMVKVYWASGKLPVRMPLYVAMVAMARYIIIEIKSLDQLRVLAIAASILIIGCAVLVVRWGHIRLPYVDED